MSQAEFALVLVVAPGEEAKMGRPWMEIRVDIDGESLNERDLNPGCPRCLMLFDCVESSAVFPRLARLEVPSSKGTRALFDDAVMRAEGGLAKVFAGRDAHATNLIAALMIAGIRWAQEKSGILSVGEAADALPHITAQDYRAPTVKYRGGRRQHDFPLCVSDKSHQP